MPEYRRLECPGATIFFTVVTHRRQPILTKNAIPILREAVAIEIQTRPFTVDAAVILPDHLHMIWTLPPNDRDFSTRWSRIKARFSYAYLKSGGAEANRTDSRSKRSERGVWQRRFWDHVIRDDREFGAYTDYIHFNPVKHGHAQCPHDWPQSSFHKYVREGVYTQDWLCDCYKRRPRELPFEKAATNTGE